MATNVRLPNVLELSLRWQWPTVRKPPLCHQLHTPLQSCFQATGSQSPAQMFLEGAEQLTEALEQSCNLPDQALGPQAVGGAGEAEPGCPGSPGVVQAATTRLQPPPGPGASSTTFLHGKERSLSGEARAASSGPASSALPQPRAQRNCFWEPRERRKSGTFPAGHCKTGRWLCTRGDMASSINDLMSHKELRASP